MNKRLIISIILVVMWMAFIFIMSSMNNDDSNNASETIVIDVIHKVDKITKASEETIKNHQSFDFINDSNYMFRKFSHAFVYFVLAILLFNLLIQLMKKSFWIKNFLIILICFLYACTDEFHQTLVMGRDGQFTDILIDTLGALVGCLFINLVYSLARKHYHKPL